MIGFAYAKKVILPVPVLVRFLLKWASNGLILENANVYGSCLQSFIYYRMKNKIQLKCNKVAKMVANISFLMNLYFIFIGLESNNPSLY